MVENARDKSLFCQHSPLELRIFSMHLRHSLLKKKKKKRTEAISYNHDLPHFFYLHICL